MSSRPRNTISIHALLAESDFRGWTLNINGPIFLSTLSLRRATRCQASDISIKRISIHALLAESDMRHNRLKPRQTNFYPRSPCGERRKKSPLKCSVRHFYPRSPCGERHDTSSLMQCQVKFLSTLSLRRATHLFASSGVDFAISIHALLAESDT